MRKLFHVFTIYFFLFSFHLTAEESFLFDDGFPQPVKAELISEESSIQAGRPFWVGLRLELESGWHSYWTNPGDAGLPPQIDWSLPAGFVADPIKWPTPERFEVDDMVGFGYSKEVILLVKITPPQSFEALESNGSVTMEADVSWLVCNEQCLPGDAVLKLELPITDTEPKVNATWASHFATTRKCLPIAAQKAAVHKEGEWLMLSVSEDSNPLQNPSKVQFFPYEEGVVNHQKKQYINGCGISAKGCKLAIPIQNSVQKDGATVLKGILVVEKEVENEVVKQSFIIDSDIIDTEASPSQMPPASSGGEEPVSGLLVALISAFVGGLILNIMPCVLPVISIKILGFVNAAGDDRKKIFQHGLLFVAGVLISFWVLASVLLLLQAYGEAVGWGFQLQDPRFVAVLATVLLVLALSLFGVFEMGVSIASKAGQAAQKQSQGMLGAFSSGVLATAVATPCTGPLLGPVLAYAMTLDYFSSLAIFTTMGLGMAFPYLLLSAFPSYLKYLPKPGPWMETFKQSMGFLMLASALWLLWVFGAQTDNDTLFHLMSGLVILTIGCWMYGRWISPFKKMKQQIFQYGIVLFFCVIGCHTMYSAAFVSTQQEHEAIANDWEPYSGDRLDTLRMEGVPVFVDFTAKWCMTCQFNKAALALPQVREEFEKHGVVKMRADWTKFDGSITEALAKHGRNSVPLYVLFPGNETAEPIILPQTLTPNIISDAIHDLY